MKRRERSKILAIITAIAVAVTMAPMVAFAADGEAGEGRTGDTSGSVKLNNPVYVSGTQYKEVSTWDCIYFGNYPQSDTEFETPEPIKWRVLSVNGSDAFLLSDKILDTLQFSTTEDDYTWSSSNLEKKLNNNIYNNDSIFTQEQRAAIKKTAVENKKNPRYPETTEDGITTMDYIFVLSMDEVLNPDYGFRPDIRVSNTRAAKITRYADEYGEYTDSNGYGQYWLRTVGGRGKAVSIVDNGDENGLIEIGGKNPTFTYGVRPALHIDLSKGGWSYAGAVDSNGNTAPGRIADIELSADSFEYTGEEIKPDVTVKCSDGTTLDSTKYNVTYEKNVELGQATVTVKGTDECAYKGELTKSFEIKKANIENADITLTPPKATYTGASIRPEATVVLGGKTLIEGENYFVKYSSNKEVGQATATIKGMGNYTGTVEKNFDIEKIQLAKAKVTLSTAAAKYTGKAIEPEVTVTLNDEPLAAGEDYAVEYANNINPGVATVTITGAGNYDGTLQRTFTINPKGTSIKSVAGLSKGFTVKWAKSAAANATGYQVRYSTKSSMAGAKTVKITSYKTVSKKVTKLKAKKKYYVQVRVYKTVSGKTYCSAWSAKKAVKTK